MNPEIVDFPWFHKSTNHVPEAPLVYYGSLTTEGDRKSVEIQDKVSQLRPHGHPVLPVTLACFCMFEFKPVANFGYT